MRFLQADVNKLALEASSQDVVFSCWLLMYLSDDEVCELVLMVLWVGLGNGVGGARQLTAIPTRPCFPHKDSETGRKPVVLDQGGWVCVLQGVMLHSWR